MAKQKTAERHWGNWRKLKPDVVFPTESMLNLTLTGGQAFRWRPLGSGIWQGVWERAVVQVRLDGTHLMWRKRTGDTSVSEKTVQLYFCADRNFEGVIDLLPWRSDAVLKRALDALPGLRLLKQPFGETLLCYLCSSLKRIEQIREGCDALARAFGEAITGDIHALPTWERLVEVDEGALRACGIGYRARHIAATANWLARRTGWLGETEGLPYAEARERLMLLPGVGGKIADCVLLYGGGKLESFPGDTWILNVMKNHYGLDGWKPEQVMQFGLLLFGPNPGLAQQFLFEAARLGKL